MSHAKLTARANSLLLVTQNFPALQGDAPFVAGEIEALAHYFERVYLWSASRPKRGVAFARLPANVKYMGCLSAGGPLGTILRAMSPNCIASLMRVMYRELRERGAEVSVPRLVRTGALAVYGTRRIRQDLASEGQDIASSVLYSFWGTDCAAVLTALPVAPAFCAVRFHGYDLYEERVGYLPFRRDILERADLLLTVSRQGKRYLEERWQGRISLPAVEVALLGTPDLHPGPGRPRNIDRFVSCSSVIPLKRVGMIFDALVELSKRQEVEWIHFGDGPGLHELRARAAASPGSLRVCLPGNVPNKKVLEFYETAQVSGFINLSTTEGLPVSIMEALGAGIPVLATDVGGTGEIVGKGLSSGLLIGPDPTVGEVVDGLLALLSPERPWNPRAVWESICRGAVNSARLANLLANAGGSSK